MTSSWLSDVTELFDNKVRQHSFKHRFARKRDDAMNKANNNAHSAGNIIQDEDDSGDSEHCCTVERAKHIFDKKYSLNDIDYDPINQFSKPSIKTVSSFDIFSGTVVDLDIPPIEADIEEDGVYPCADAGPLADKLAFPANGEQIEKQTNPIMKSNSHANRKSNFKKSSAKSFPNKSEVDKENEGVMIRMRNQESYYDGRDKYQSQLPEPPLYQVYEKTRMRRSVFAQKPFDKPVVDPEESRETIQNSIIYPDIPLPPVDKNCRMHDKQNQEEDNDSIELEPSDSYPDNRMFQLFSENSQKLRWAETEEGKKLIKMQKLDKDTITWQEAQFEVITSEASYYRSLEILVNKIYKSSAMDCYKDRSPTYTSDKFNMDSDDIICPLIKPIISATQKHHLFSNILEIHIVSGELLKALESRWRENPFITDLSDIIIDFCQEKLKVYITYLRNQQYQNITYNELLKIPEFNSTIKSFQTDPDFGMMDLNSFLGLPFQRTMRLKILFDNVKKNIPKNMSSSGCEAAIEALEKLIIECSDAKMVMDQKQQILEICNRLIIKDKMNVSIGSKPLLKEGQMKITANNSIASKSMGGGFIGMNNNKAMLYLFEDQLIIAKHRKLPLCVSPPDNREVVVDTCPRANVKFDLGSMSPKLPNRVGTNFKLILSRGMKGCAEYACTVETQEELNGWRNMFYEEDSISSGFEFSEAYVIKDYSPTSKNEMELKKGQILSIIKRIDKDRAIAVSSGKPGEIYLKYVQLISTPQPNPELMNEIRLSVSPKRIN